MVDLAEDTTGLGEDSRSVQQELPASTVIDAGAVFKADWRPIAWVIIQPHIHRLLIVFTLDGNQDGLVDVLSTK